MTTTETTLTDPIHAAYADLIAEAGAETGTWVSLRRIREQLDTLSDILDLGITRADVDAALMDMALEPDVLIDPEFNQKTLTEADRAAAIHMGGENCHLLSIGRR